MTEWDVTISDRRGNNPRSLGDIRSVSVEDRLNDDPQVTVEAASCRTLDGIEPWAHRLTVSCDGVTVADGPVLKVNGGDGTVAILAGGGLSWLKRRLVASGFSMSATPVAWVRRVIESVLDAEQYFRDNMGVYGAIDPGLQLWFPRGAPGRKALFTATAWTEAWSDHIEPLASNSVDIVASGMRIGVVPYGMPVSDMGYALTGWRSPPGVELDGETYANRVVGTGSVKDGEDVRVEGSLPDDDPLALLAALDRYGLVESVEDYGEVAGSDGVTAVRGLAGDTRRNRYRRPAVTVGLDDDLVFAPNACPDLTAIQLGVGVWVSADRSDGTPVQYYGRIVERVITFSDGVTTVALSMSSEGMTNGV